AVRPARASHPGLPRLIASLTVLPAPLTSPLPLHDALPIYPAPARPPPGARSRASAARRPAASAWAAPRSPSWAPGRDCAGSAPRSEEHTSELQSRFDLVCRLLLEIKKYSRAVH